MSSRSHIDFACHVTKIFEPVLDHGVVYAQELCHRLLIWPQDADDYSQAQTDIPLVSSDWTVQALPQAAPRAR
jgi:hypothetical protein